MDFSQLGGLLDGMKKEFSQLEERNKGTIHTSKSGGGMVSVSFNGVGELVDLQIDDSLLEDKEAMQIYLMSALNDGYKAVEENRKNLAFNMLGNFAKL
ncbi:YbaB/EbfC family nucleoid-associated protein [Helicobacter pylori]|uniref:YbaB/EbfC family nucleoid-associated protein n=1 Tax=Helicobacter pylori TaxID=210 RepID=UPI001FF3F468|nr:YbaB/EbfC family nucleoid-associated protein [Helicobacter pylori]MCJ8495497.1 YbaB/EbfC family nucleoid-associated protein [Helicobacter pylori]